MNMKMIEVVASYSALGGHRTGTQDDEKTIAWLVDQLKQRGAEAEVKPFPLERYDVSCKLSIAGQAVEAWPLYYCFEGAVETEKVAITNLDIQGCDEVAAMEIIRHDVVAATEQGFEALVVFTKSMTGDVYAINRPEIESFPIPVVLVGSKYASGTKDGKIKVKFEATTAPATSGTVVGYFGDYTLPAPFIITTPLSGWFTSAGERGGGLAIALQLAQTMAKKIPVMLVSPSGHELGHKGAGYFLSEADIDPESQVLHLGSCVASAGYQPDMITDQLEAICHVKGRQFPDMSRALSGLGISLRKPKNNLDPQSWVGESENWGPLGGEVLSIAGVDPRFHSPADTFEYATTPEILDHAYSCIEAAVNAMMKG